MVPAVVRPRDMLYDREMKHMVVRLGATLLIYFRTFELGAKVESTNKIISFDVFYL